MFFIRRLLRDVGCYGNVGLGVGYWERIVLCCKGRWDIRDIYSLIKIYFIEFSGRCLEFVFVMFK